MKRRKTGSALHFQKIPLTERFSTGGEVAPLLPLGRDNVRGCDCHLVVEVSLAARRPARRGTAHHEEPGPTKCPWSRGNDVEDEEAQADAGRPVRRLPQWSRRGVACRLGVVVVDMGQEEGLENRRSSLVDVWGEEDKREI